MSASPTYPTISYLNGMSFSDRIKKLRAERGWSQTKLGNIAGVIRNAVSLWESGRSKAPSGEALTKIAAAFGRSEQWLISGKSDKIQDITRLSDGEKKLLKIWRELNADNKRKLLSMAILERSIQFTGDESKRAEFQRMISAVEDIPEEL